MAPSRVYPRKGSAAQLPNNRSESALVTKRANPRNSTETQTWPGLARIAVFTVRHFISSDFTSPCQRQVNRQRPPYLRAQVV